MNESDHKNLGVSFVLRHPNDRGIATMTNATASRSGVIVGLGEVLWDIFPHAKYFGGAPANFACHAAALGAEAWMVSAVGKDDLGIRALAELRAAKVHVDAVQANARPTGTVTVSLDTQKQATYTFANDVAWDRIDWNVPLSDLAQRCDAVCFGTLAQRDPRSRSSIQKFLKATRPKALRVFDVNLRQHFYDVSIVGESLVAANFVKLNSDELPVIAKMLNVSCVSEAQTLSELCARFNLHGAALTRGAMGSLLFWDGDFHEQSPVPIEVVDTVGAGDAFTAAIVVGLLNGDELPNVHRHASAVASYVCTQPGATPSLPVSLFYENYPH